jgi:hypothetical protein
VAKRAELKLEIGGLLDNAHLAWVTPPRLTIGDEITIRIVETEQPDPASSIKRDDPKLGEDGERKYYERLKNKYEGR